jgi:hypothetical protein
MSARVRVTGLSLAVFFISCFSARAQGLGFYGAGFASNYYFKERYTFHDGTGFGGFFSVPLWVLDLGADVQYSKRARKENDVFVTYCTECIRSGFPPTQTRPHPMYKSLTDRIFISRVLSVKGMLDFRVIQKDSFQVKIGPRVGINYLRQLVKYTNENIPWDHELAVYSPSLGVESSFYWKYVFHSPGITWFVKPGADAMITGNWQGILDANVSFSEVPVTGLFYVKTGLLFGRL